MPLATSVLHPPVLAAISLMFPIFLPPFSYSLEINIKFSTSSMISITFWKTYHIYLECHFVRMIFFFFFAIVRNRFCFIFYFSKWRKNEVIVRIANKFNSDETLALMKLPSQIFNLNVSMKFLEHIYLGFSVYFNFRKFFLNQGHI